MARTLTRAQLSGSNSPTFIIKVDNAYYVTQSVAIYDRERATTPEQISDIDGVRALYESARKNGGSREAVELSPQNNAMSFQHVVSD